MNNSNITISRLTHVNDNVLTQINALLPQLTSNFKPLTLNQLSSIAEAAATTPFVAIDIQTDTIVGMVLMVTIRQFVGTKCWIEDLVVSGNYRGRGIARLLLEAAVASAPHPVRSIDLTSKPGRASAYPLYTTMGFNPHDTLVFRLTPDAHPNGS